MRRTILVTMILVSLLLNVLSANIYAADNTPYGPPSETYYDGFKMVGEPDPVYTEESGFDVVILQDDGRSIRVPQNLSTEEPLYASYLLGANLWEYAPEGHVLDGLYTDQACTTRFLWGTCVGKGMSLFARIR